MTNKKKRIVLICAVAGIICATVLISSMMNKKSEPAVPVVSSNIASASSPSSSADMGGFFNAQSNTVSSAADTDYTSTLSADAQKVLHLRYDLSDTSVSPDVLKQYLRDYMTDDALKQMFSNTSSEQSKASAAPVSSAAPISSAPAQQRPASSAPAKAAASSAPSTSSKPAASSAPDVTYRPIQGAVTPRLASFQPVTKTYSYATVSRLYTKALQGTQENVLIYYTLSVAGDNMPSNTSNRVMSLNMKYSKSAGHWIVTKMELDAKVDFSLAPFQK